MGLLVPPLGRRLAVVVHGDKWLTSKHGSHVDWVRLSDVVHCTVLHAVMTAYVAIVLRDEMVGWYQEPSQWWAFMQPALSESLRIYYLLELGVTCEASVSMLRNVMSGRAKDLPMMIHHAATLFVFLSAYRFGFVRVGAAVVALHDASDLPIDGIRIAQALEIEPLLYVSAASAVLSWAYMRAYCFPRYIISSAIMCTGHIWHIYDFVGDAFIYCGYAIYIIPLVMLWLLSCHWLRQLVAKLRLAIAVCHK
tara:strand:+ start:164 stop:916 length:753 start_codon:yes stop_codon:yes gene_type:complete